MTDLKNSNDDLKKKNLGDYWQSVPKVDRQPASYAPDLWKWQHVDEAIH